MPTWSEVREWIFSGLTQNLLWVIVGIIFVQAIQRPWDNFWHGGWQVIITKNGKPLLQKKISPAKAKHINSVPEDKLIFLKGLIAPFETLNCDLLEDGPARGLYREEIPAKRISINLDHNPRSVRSRKRVNL